MTDITEISFEWCDGDVFGMSPIPEDEDGEDDGVRPSTSTTVQEQSAATFLDLGAAQTQPYPQKVMEIALNAPPSNERVLIVGVIATSSLIRANSMSNLHRIFRGPRGHLN